MKVLIVEDNAVNRKTALAILKKAFQQKNIPDVEFFEASTGETAVALVEASDTDFDLIYMDHDLGRGINGTLTTAYIRAIEERKQNGRSVIFSCTDSLTGKIASTDFFVEKPVTRAKMESIVDSMVTNPDVLRSRTPIPPRTPTPPTAPRSPGYRPEACFPALSSSALSSAPAQPRPLRMFSPVNLPLYNEVLEVSGQAVGSQEVENPGEKGRAIEEQRLEM